MRGEVTVRIAAPAKRVYDLVSDITRMGEWSPENAGGRWIEGDGPKAGAKFSGDNKLGPMKWTTQCEVVAATPGREFSFQTGATRWSYRLVEVDGGTDVTESWEAVHPLPTWERVWMRFGREPMLRRGMRSTLERLKAAAEAG